MSDLIERNNAINAIVKMPFKIDADGYNWILRIDVLKELEDIPSTNSKPKKGKWIDTTWKHTYKCSECGNFLEFHGVNAGRGDANYCPNCGADMRDKDE